MGGALSAAAALMLIGMLGLIPAGGTATTFPPSAFAIAVVVSIVLGALLTVGIGNYAPSLIIFGLLGMDPRAAFPIMMGSGAFVATHRRRAIRRPRTFRSARRPGSRARRHPGRAGRGVGGSIAAARYLAMAGAARRDLLGDLTCSDGAREPGRSTNPDEHRCDDVVASRSQEGETLCGGRADPIDEMTAVQPVVVESRRAFDANVRMYISNLAILKNDKQ